MAISSVQGNAQGSSTPVGHCSQAAADAPAAERPASEVLRSFQVRLGVWLALRWALVLLAALGAAALAGVYGDAAFILSDEVRAQWPWALSLAGLAVLAAGLSGLPALRAIRVARRVEEGDRSLGSALSNAVELSAFVPATPVQEVLRSRTIERGREKARRLKSWPLEKHRVLSAMGLLLVAVLAWEASWLLAPGLLQSVVPRFLDPYGDHPPYSRLRFEVTPGNTEVTYGASCEIRAKAIGLPVEKLYLVTRSGGELSRSFLFVASDRTFFQTLTNLRAETEYVVTDGRARSLRYRIGVRTTPQITSVELEAEFPAYTKKPRLGVSLGEETLQFPAGTRLAWVVRSNRRLASGLLSLTPILGGQVESVGLAAPPDSPIVVGSFVLNEAIAFQLSVTDVEGLESEESRRGRILVIPDVRPRIRVIEPGRHAVATPEARVPVVVQAEDDFGITRVLWFRGHNGSVERPSDMSFEAAGGPARVEARGAFDLAALGVRPGDRIDYFFEAADNDPRGPQVTSSRFYTLQVIPEEEYREVLRRASARRALFESYQRLGPWLRRLAERARALARKAQTASEGKGDGEAGREARRQEGAALALELARYQEALAATLGQRALFDIEASFRTELERQKRMIDQLQKLMDDRGGEPSPDSLAAVARMLEELSLAEQERIGEPVRHVASVAKLLSRADLFTRLALGQAELARLARRFEDRPSDRLARVEQMELQEIAQAQQQISSGLHRLLAELPDLLSQVPADEKYDELRRSVGEFIVQVREAKIPDDLVRAAREFADLNGPQGYPLARDAAEKMEKLVSFCRAMPGQGQQCLLRFQPSLSESLGNSLQQILSALSGSFGPAGGDGFSMLNEEVGLYGPDAELAGMPSSGGDETIGPASAGDARDAHRAEMQPAEPGDSGQPAAVQLQRDVRSPLRYRQLVGEYFRAVVESEEAP